MEIVLALVGLAIGVGLGAGGLFVYQKNQGTNRIKLAEDEAARITSEAQEPGQTNHCGCERRSHTCPARSRRKCQKTPCRT